MFYYKKYPHERNNWQIRKEWVKQPHNNCGKETEKTSLNIKVFWTKEDDFRGKTLRAFHIKYIDGSTLFCLKTRIGRHCNDSKKLKDRKIGLNIQYKNILKML